MLSCCKCVTVGHAIFSGDEYDAMMEQPVAMPWYILFLHMRSPFPLHLVVPYVTYMTLTNLLTILALTKHLGNYRVRVLGLIVSFPSIYGRRTSGMVTVMLRSSQPVSSMAASTLGTARAVPLTVQG